MSPNSVCLSFFVHENRKHRHRLVHEWLLEQAGNMGIQGGSVFRGIAGFGRHGVQHEEHFFELQGDLPVRVMFILSETQAEAFLELLRREDLSLFYLKTAAESGVTGPA